MEATKRRFSPVNTLFYFLELALLTWFSSKLYKREAVGNNKTFVNITTIIFSINLEGTITSCNKKVTFYPTSQQFSVNKVKIKK